MFTYCFSFLPFSSCQLALMRMSVAWRKLQQVSKSPFSILQNSNHSLTRHLYMSQECFFQMEICDQDLSVLLKRWLLCQSDPDLLFPEWVWIQNNCFLISCGSHSEESFHLESERFHAGQQVIVLSQLYTGILYNICWSILYLVYASCNLSVLTYKREHKAHRPPAHI